MLRIIFNNGEILDADNIDRVYVEQADMDKVIPWKHSLEWKLGTKEDKSEVEGE